MLDLYEAAPGGAAGVRWFGSGVAHERRRALKAGIAATALLAAFASPARAADLPPTPPPVMASGYNWTGFYFGGHVGLAINPTSNYAAPGVNGSIDLRQTLDTFAEAGNFLVGMQGGYNYMLANRIVLGVEADLTTPAYPNTKGFGSGNQTAFVSPTKGAEIYSDDLLLAGTVRGRIGYAPGNWLVYATGGFAWTREQLGVTELRTGANDYPYIWRYGYAVGAGIEAPIAPHWTGRLEYLFTDYGNQGSYYTTTGQRISSNLTMNEVRAGVNYRFGDDASTVAQHTLFGTPEDDRINFHAQATEVAQGNAAFHAPYSGDNSLPNHAQVEQTTDVTLYAGIRLWHNAEFWINPEIDQGFGLGNTHGIAGFPSAEAYKLGYSWPYARVQRYFVRDEIDLGGASQDVDADINQFKQTQTANRLVLTLGKLNAADIFDTNKYANNPKVDFLNWTMVNTGTFDYAGDAWGFSYGGVAELYEGRFAFRAGVFDLSQTPAGGAQNAAGYGLDPYFHNVELLAEIEERHTMFGQDGKIKLLGYDARGDACSFGQAVSLSALTGVDASDACADVRKFRDKPGISVNIEQGLTDTVGAFFRAGYSDGSSEPWDFTDVDRTVSGGLSFNGKPWGRPDDTFGIGGVINGIAPVHAAYFAAGGDGILIGDGQLPNVQVEKIFEAYYSYSLSSAVKVSADYQFVDDPAYNPQRGPVNIGALRLHVQY